MATTKLILIERVMKILAGGNPSTRDRYSRAQVAHELNAAIAKALRLQIWDGYKNGERTPSPCAIAFYENLGFERLDQNRSMIALPAMPMELPKGAGVFRVYPSGYPDDEFIPLRAGMLYALKGDKLMSALGPKTYTYQGGRVIINTDAIAAGVNSVDMELVVADITTLSDNAVLPLPADLEPDVITYTLQLLGAENMTSRSDDRQPSPSKTDAG